MEVLLVEDGGELDFLVFLAYLPLFALEGLFTGL